MVFCFVFSCSYFFDINALLAKEKSGTVFEKLVKRFRGRFKMDISRAIRVIYKHQLSLNHDPNMLLGIDEWKLCRGQKALLTALGDAVGKGLFLTVVITTLDTILSSQKPGDPQPAQQTDSGRYLGWAFLPHLSSYGSLQVLADLQVNDNRVDTTAVQFLGLSANGHPRSLCVINKVIGKVRVSHSLNTYVTRLEDEKELAQSVSWSLLILALRGDPININTRIKNTDDPSLNNLTVRELIACGRLLNSLDRNTKTCVPQLSLLSIMRSTDLSLFEDPTFKSLRGFFDHLPSKVGVDECFELFHSLWEALRRLLFFPCTKTLILKARLIADIYSTRFVTGALRSPITLSGSDCTIILDRSTNAAVKDVKQHSVLTTGLQIPPPPFPRDHFNTSTAYQLGGANPGFDHLIFEKTEDDKVIAIMVECKYSDPKSSTVFNKTDLAQKVVLCLAVFDQYLRGLSPSLILLSFYPHSDRSNRTRSGRQNAPTVLSTLHHVCSLEEILLIQRSQR